MPIKSFKKLIQSLYHVRMCVRERLIEIDRQREGESEGMQWIISQPQVVN